MRRRPVPPAPPGYDPPDAEGLTERDRAIAHFGADDWQQLEHDPTTRFVFSAYRDANQALMDEFGGLCAYCEAPIDVGSHGHVEHYRPKGAVDTPTQKGSRPGYYWLASTLSNLLPACGRCNTSGKRNSFPLADETRRARRPGGETDEQPLLLNPYEDAPEQHLEFVEGGELRPRDDCPRGRTTIDVLKLNRPGLRDRRRDHLVTAKATLQAALDAERDCEEYAGDPALAIPLRRAVAARERALTDLERLLAPGQPYAAMVAQLIGLAHPDDGASPLLTGS